MAGTCRRAFIARSCRTDSHRGHAGARRSFWRTRRGPESATATSCSADCLVCVFRLLAVSWSFQARRARASFESAKSPIMQRAAERQSSGEETLFCIQEQPGQRTSLLQLRLVKNRRTRLCVRPRHRLMRHMPGAVSYGSQVLTGPNTPNAQSTRRIDYIRQRTLLERANAISV